MVDPLGQAWQSGSALATMTPGRDIVYKHRLFGSLLFEKNLIGNSFLFWNNFFKFC